MNKTEKCWCRELYGLPDDFECKKFECGRYRINIRKEKEEESTSDINSKASENLNKQSVNLNKT